MSKDHIESIIIRFLNKQANRYDLDLLSERIGNFSSNRVFRKFVKINYLITLAMSNPDATRIRNILLKKIRQDKSLQIRKRVYSSLKYAAIVILIISLGILVYEDFNSNNQIDNLIPQKESIALELENGEIKYFDDDDNLELLDPDGNPIGTKKGNKLIYNKHPKLDKIVYNVLTVPYGERIEIVLSDGTSIYLNSGSSLKYPINFIDEGNRQVYLTGEAFFNVAHNEQNPFVLVSEELNVKVLGTKFNLSNYPENPDTEVVLVEGSVNMTSSEQVDGNISKSQILKPGFKGVFNKYDYSIQTEKVDVSRYTSWIEGKIIFRDTPFDKIIKKLERHYNLVIINNNEKLSNETFNATIETKSETIEQVLNYFKVVYDIEYQIVENKVIIK